MKTRLLLIPGIALIVIVFNLVQLSHAESTPFGDPDNVAFAEKLWQAMEELNLAGESANPDTPYKGTHPHGTVLETLTSTLSINGRQGEVLVKRNYGGTGVSTAAVDDNRRKYIQDITVMFKRESGYDEANQNWFWAKFSPDGTLESNPRGLKLAGRVAKGKDKGCIACHQGAPGGDFLFVN